MQRRAKSGNTSSSIDMKVEDAVDERGTSFEAELCSINLGHPRFAASFG